MSEIIINGGKRLSGKVNVQGAKNSVLPVLAGTVLCGGGKLVGSFSNLTLPRENGGYTLWGGVWFKKKKERTIQRT